MSRPPPPESDPKQQERDARLIMAAFYSPEETEALRRLEEVERQVERARAVIKFSAIMRRMPPPGQS
jgi:hypothetical protein